MLAEPLLGGTVVGGVPSLQATPFKLKSVGMTTVPDVRLPCIPKFAVPPLALIVPFQWLDGLLADTLLPVWETVTFQAEVTTWPAAWVKVRSQPETAVPE